jgi:Uma2 family endonuclease
MTTLITPVEADNKGNLQESEEENKMAGGEHGEIAIILSSHLFNYVYPRKIGRLFDGQTSFQVGGTPPKRLPDVAFVTIERMPERITGPLPFAPDLAVEIVSENDTVYELETKIIQYQQAQVRLIWIIYPVTHTVAVYHPHDLKPTVLSVNDELDGENVIEGFRLKISLLF